MSAITKEFTKEQLQQIIETDHVQCGEASALARIALASLEAEPVAYIFKHPAGRLFWALTDESNKGQSDVMPVYTAPPAPVALPSGYSDFEEIWSSSTHPLTQDDEMKDFAWDIWNACRAAMLQGSSPPAPVSAPDEDLLHMAASAIEDLLSNKDRYCAGVWADIPAKLRRAAMLQGADGTLTNEGTIPVTQFKPVADLYGLTSPTGGETSFTFDAVEARDFIDGGWSCQEYVELGRYQEALTDHSEDKLAMVDHSGDSNNMVEPVTTACKLRDAVETIRNSGIEIDAEKIFAERDALNAPDCWCRACRPITLTDMRFVVCPDCGNKRCPHANDHRNACTGSNEPGQEGSAYPAAPQQEA